MKLFKQSLLINVWLTLLLGLAYPFVMTGLAQVLFPAREWEPRLQEWSRRRAPS